MTARLSQPVIEALDLPTQHSGPYVLIEIASQMLVKNLRYSLTLEGLIHHVVTLHQGAPVNPGSVFRVIQESDLRSYMAIANENYRAWWDGDDFVAPENWRDATQVPRLYPLSRD